MTQPFRRQDRQAGAARGPQPERRRNVELKAADPDPVRSLEACHRLGAEDRGVHVQRDTYFRVPAGRLKLREEEGSDPHLVAYERPDVAGRRLSRYRIVPVTDAEALGAALAETLGVEAVVRKRRRLFVWQGVRIHLDEVEGLGAFVEFEALAAPGSDLSREEEQVRMLCEAFGLAEEEAIGGSYCDLMTQRR